MLWPTCRVSCDDQLKAHRRHETTRMCSDNRCADKATDLLQSRLKRVAWKLVRTIAELASCLDMTGAARFVRARGVNMSTHLLSQLFRMC
jgi:hypothetical protein